MTDITPTYENLSTLLKNRLFKIPPYQRGYSWTKYEREDLFSDIKKTFEKPGSSHFMATVVCLLEPNTKLLGTDVHKVLSIVDGQQRITTLVLLLNAIKIKLNLNDSFEKRAKQEIEELLVKDESNDLLLLQTNHDSNHHFEKYLREDKIPSLRCEKSHVDNELIEAVHEVSKFVSDWTIERDLISLFGLLKNQLRFLVHQTSDDKSVYSVFEVLNSRGLAVSALDRLKSIFMGISFDLNNQDLIQDLRFAWREIYQCVGSDKLVSQEVLRFAATFKSKSLPRRPVSEDDSVDIMRKLAIDAKAVRMISSWILEVARAYINVIGNSRASAANKISQARFLATAINLRQDFDQPTREMLLRLWEKITFKIYGIFIDDQRKNVKEYVNLGFNVVNDRLDSDAIKCGLEKIGGDFPIRIAVEKLRNRDCYKGWETELRYLMSKYEEHLAEQAHNIYSNQVWLRIWEQSTAKSIEHIMPRSKATITHKNRLGNLVLLEPGLNSKLKDLPPLEKSGRYKETGLLIAKEVAESIESIKDWSDASIDARGEKILAWISIAWAD